MQMSAWKFPVNCAIVLSIVLMVIVLMFGRPALAFDSRNDGLYKIDVEATKESEIFQKFLKKNPAGSLGLQLMSQLMEHIRIRNGIMRVYSAECKLRQEKNSIKADCIDSITEQSSQGLEIVFDGEMLIFLGDDYPVFYRKR